MSSSSYDAQQSWEQLQTTYGHTGLQLEQEFGYAAAPSSGYDNTYAYTQANPQSNTANVGNASSVTNGSAYIQSSSSSRMPTYRNVAPNQSLASTGPYALGGYAASPSAQGDNIYATNQYTTQTVTNRTHYEPSATFNQQNHASIPISNLSITDDSRQLSNGSYTENAVPVHEMNRSYSQPLPQPSYYQSPQSMVDPGSKVKRQRSQYSGETADEQDAEQPDTKEGTRPRLGACSRCKSLKVRCEFKSDSDPCKRCLNGGHDCIIPGRKKRRTPPKREHLLNEIREQAAQIQKLMAQLELSNKASSEVPSTPDLLSPLTSPISSASVLTRSEVSKNGDSTVDGTTKAVAEWIAKAKESLGVFGDHIDMAGASMPKNLLAGDDQEDEPDDDGYYTAYDEEEVGIAIECMSDEGKSPSAVSVPKPVRNRDSISSFNSDDTSSYAGRKPPGDEKGAIIPTKAAPFGLFGDMSLNLNKKRGGSVDPEEQEDKVTGIASDSFFRPTPAPDNLGNRLSSSHVAPHIISRGIITVSEAEALFKIYFDNMNLSLSLLDPVLYTAPNTFFRSPFLFTVICAISSRFYTTRPELYKEAMHYAQLAAGTALISGKKDVDMCHAYILLSLYPVPAKRWEDQRSWLYLGLAIRTATELNLHLPVTSIPQSEMPAREVLNRARVWLNCFNVDRSTGSQYGKPPIINSMDYQANHSRDWWRSSPYNMKNFDIHLCVYNNELRVAAGFIAKIFNDPENPTGLNKNADFEALAAATDDELKRLREQWFEVIKENTDANDDQGRFRTGLLKLAYSYGRLVVLSYGFQHAFGKNNTDENPFLLRCLSAAEDVVHAVVNDICGDAKMRHYWRHGPEAQSVFITFASAFLVKLLQPKFASYLTTEKRHDIRNKVQGVINLLSSPDIAIDDRHGPKLYARFLEGLLNAPMARLESQSPTNSVTSLPRHRSARRVKSATSPTSESAQPESPTAARSSLSPRPNQQALSFEHFAPMGGASDPFAQGTYSIGQTQDAIGLGVTNMADLFQPPLHIDTQIMENLQNVGDVTAWSSYNWLSHYQNLQQNFAMDFRSTTGMMMQEDEFNVYGAGEQ
ncbi:hypothetical protein AX17_007394 [Amanita inopinata Kibby_2008]|nr:hypothetical protein AX17_007394 [Amanita inopinata Kibby_2008]